MSPGQSPRPAGPMADNAAVRTPQYQRSQQQMNCSESSNKKQATPSQKRLQKQHRQQQQQQQQQQQAQDGHQKGSQTVGQSAATDKTRELDVKVDKLTDKNECCKLKISSRLEEFSRKAGEIKAGISAALERQQGRAVEDQTALASVDELRGRFCDLAVRSADEPESVIQDNTSEAGGDAGQLSSSVNEPNIEQKSEDNSTNPAPPEEEPAQAAIEQPPASGNTEQDQSERALDVGEAGASLESEAQDQSGPGIGDSLSPSGGCFEPLSARLDPKSKFVALKSSLEKQFGAAPELLEPICIKLINMSRQIDQLRQQNEGYQQEVGKLRLIKCRLGDLCRELQKSNNQIRIESLSLIKTEQQKAKEQADKIQTTLAGVMKLFDENQQRNLSLRQENTDLQAKLKQLLEHCENWEQCVETAIKQRDIENRLVKTELTRLSLIRNEEQERSLKEKQELLKAIETMKSHQSRVEDKEAKLRSDLSSYASKYDQCQELIQNGLGKFQVESKRMLKQIERSRQDYVTLLNKYEASNKKIKQLLEEKQAWMKSTAQTNKKLETLEKLCRSLKSENDRLLRETPTGPAQVCPAPCAATSANEPAGGAAPAHQRVPLVVINDHLPAESN